MKWVKASERMPDKQGRYAVKRLGEIMTCDCRKYRNGLFVFTTPNGMAWKGYMQFEWLDETVDKLHNVEDVWKVYFNDENYNYKSFTQFCIENSWAFVKITN